MNVIIPSDRSQSLVSTREFIVEVVPKSGELFTHNSAFTQQTSHKKSKNYVMTTGKPSQCRLMRIIVLVMFCGNTSAFAAIKL